MKKIFIIILSFFIFSSVSAKCEGVTYFSNHEHYYNNEGSFCKLGEETITFQSINKNLTKNNIWNGKEYSFLADMYLRENGLTKSRVILNGKNLVEFKYKTESVFTKFLYSLSGKHIFTSFMNESGIVIDDYDKDVFGFYIDGKKIFKGYPINSKVIYKRTGLILEEQIPSKEFITKNDIKVLDNFLEKYKKLSTEKKKEIKEKLESEVVKYLDKSLIIFDGSRFNYDSDYKRYFIINYLLQEIIIDELKKS